MNIHVKGQLISLRDLTHDDITDRYLSWFRDGTVTQFLSARNLQRDGPASGHRATESIPDPRIQHARWRERHKRTRYWSNCRRRRRQGDEITRSHHHNNKQQESLTFH